MSKGDNYMVKQIYYGTYNSDLIRLVHDKIAGTAIILMMVDNAAKSSE